ncbi:DHH family phosphoesterase [Halorubrum halodurans]|uniref:DHH family phosphoesterase n=1 Tax=Halorubrum halodurans TaxID=1383851 RepID=A0A256ILA4_9EURY|nr:DHH family phosphoesterase [Halorubrum halodurans]OYR57233.1 DHH family phosphoesterase [Halorubrum halodurans]
MVRRLLLGCSAVGSALVEGVAEGSGKFLAVTDDAGWASTLRDRNVATVEADPTDPSAFPEHAAVVLVAGDDPTRNVAAASAARERYPDAMIVAHVGTAPAAGQVDALASVADRVVDPVEAVTARVREAVGLDDPEPGGVASGTGSSDSSERPPRLIRTIRSLDGPLLVVAHDNPDPDAIASAVGLARIAEAVGVPAEPCYGGEIAHQENRAMVNLLDLSLSTVDGADLEAYGGIALVDHSRAGINDSLPEGTPVDVVIDHHPPRGPVEGSFVDVRPDAGATSTLIAEYLSRLGIEPDRPLATALLYGIRIDTRDFTREVSIPDFEAAASLTPHVDESTLDRVESPSVSPETLRVLATAIDRRDVRGSTVASCVGEITDRDALAQAADRLLDLEGIAVTFVYGYMDGVIYGSARTRGTDLDVGELLRDALAQAGSAGGHANMAGAQVPLGILEAVAEEESLADVVEEFVAERFFEALSAPPTPPAGTSPSALDAEYPD